MASPQSAGQETSPRAPGRSALRDLLARLKSRREPVELGLQQFGTVNADQLARELDLEEQGRSRGARGEPPSTAAALDPVEERIIAATTERARRATDELHRALEVYDSRIAQAVDPGEMRVSLQAAGERALSDFKAHILTDRDALFTLREQATESDREYSHFRDRNRLHHRQARVPTARERTFRLALIFLFIVLESITNGLFFAQGSTAGVIGGITEAVVLSLLNVGAGVLYAWAGYRNLHHRSALRVVLAGIGTLAYLTFAAAFNLFVAHFRDLYAARAGQVLLPEVLDRLLAAPLALDHVQSGVLAMAGFAFALLAVIDSAGLWDPYPGYDSVARRRQDAFRRYRDEKASRLDELRDARDAAVGDMQDILGEVRALARDVGLAIRGRANLLEDYRRYLRQLSDVTRQLLDRYRQANIAARSGVPPPRHFRQDWEGSFEAPASLGLRQDAVPDYTDAINTMESYIHSINAEFKRTLDQYDPVEHLVHDAKVQQ